MIRIKVPATSANCCVGFDCLGIALNIYNEFSFEITNKLTDSNNMAIHAYEFTAKKFNKEPIALKVDIKASVPIARGLGSSSTCILAGILAADYYHKLNLTKEQIMIVASELEGHPDNVVPATIGSMALSFYKDGKLTVNPIEINGYYFLAVIPNKRIRTEDARGVLPKEIDHAKAAEQVYHAIAYIQAIQNGDEDQLYLNCVDYLHEPYRKQLISEYDELKKLSIENKIPMWISGSGSTILYCSKQKERLISIQNKIKLKTMLLNPDTVGAKIIEKDAD